MLRWLTYFLSVFCLCAGLPACTGSRALVVIQSADAPTPAQCAKFQWESVAPNVWVWYGHESNSTPANAGSISNIVFARENTGAKDAPARGWLIGSGPSQRMGRLIRCSLEQQLGAVVTDVVSPRAYPESVLGASAFADAKHWALPQVILAMQQRCPRCSLQLASSVNEKSIAHQIIGIPTQILNVLPFTEPVNQAAQSYGPFDIWSVRLDSQEWTTIFRHSASGLWLAPGLVWGVNLVPDVRDADIHQLSIALQTLDNYISSLVMPEQGKAAGPELVQLNLGYWRVLETQTLHALRLGASDGNALTANLNGIPGIAYPSDSSVIGALNSIRHSLNQQRIWRQLEQRYFDVPTP